MAKEARFYWDFMSLSSGVTGSSFINSIWFPNGEMQMIVVDHGCYQEREFEGLNSDTAVDWKKVNAVFLTHAHLDHSGRLPLAIRKGYEGKIYCTEGTMACLKPMLEDSVNIMNQRYNQNKKQIRKTSKLSQKEKGKRGRIDNGGKKKNSNTNNNEAKLKELRPLYDGFDVADTISAIECVPYERWKKLNKNISFMFLKNAHIPGSASILLKVSYPGQRSIKFLFTGDWNKRNLFLGEIDVPDKVKRMKNLHIVMESTYGTTLSSDVRPCFEANVEKAIQEGKTVLISAFAMMRAQEILYHLKQMQDDGRIPYSIPIYYGGRLTFIYTGLYHKEKSLEILEEMKDFKPQNLNQIGSDLGLILKRKEQAIYVVSSGMCNFGLSSILAKYFIRDSNALIHLTGYCAEGTWARVALEAEHGSEFRFNGCGPIKKLAEVKQTLEFSTHAKADELAECVKGIKGACVIYLNHGRQEIQEEFKKYLKKLGVKAEIVLINRSKYYRINHNSIVDVKSTKFK